MADVLQAQVPPYRPGETPQVPISLDELPTPRQVPNDAPPSAYREQATEEAPPGAGWSGTGGAITNIAGNFLHGWLRGKALAQQHLQERAQNELQGHKWLYDIAQTQMKGLVDAGVNENDPKYITAREGLMKAWGGLKGFIQGHIQPTDPKTGQPVPPGGKGIKGALSRSFKPQPVQMFGQAVSQGLDAHDPMLSFVRSPEARAKLAGATTAENTATQTGIQTDVMKLSADQQRAALNMRNEFDDLSKKYGETQSKAQAGDAAAQGQLKSLDTDLNTLRAQLETRGIKVFTPTQVATTQGQAEMEQHATQIKNAAVQKIASGQGLNWYEAAVLGTQPKDLMDVYLQNVGPDKRFRDTFQAARQVSQDQAEIYKAMYGFRSPWLMAEQDIRRAHPDWSDQQVAEAAVTMMRGSSSAKDQMMGVDKQIPYNQMVQTRADIFRAVVGRNPEFAGLLSYQVKDRNGNAQTVYGVNPNAKPVDNWIFGRSQNETPEQFATKKSGALQAAIAEARQRGLDDNNIKLLFGEYLNAPAAAPGVPATGAAPGPTGRPQPGAGGKPSRSQATATNTNQKGETAYFIGGRWYTQAQVQ